VIGIDTNVLVRALSDVEHPHHGPAKSLLAGLTQAKPGFVTQVTLAELYWVMAKSLGVDRESRLQVIRGLVETPSLEFDDGEGVVRALSLAEEGADFPDALIQGAMELFGIDETVTFDKAASKRLGWRLLSAE
jgi:predicted nucleic-acid-binding protein